MGVKTDVMAALCGVIPLLGVTRLESTSSEGGSETQGEDRPLLDAQRAVPRDTGCLSVCWTVKTLLTEPQSDLTKAGLLVSTCSRILDCSNLTSQVLDRVFAGAAFPEASGRQFEAEPKNIRG